MDIYSCMSQDELFGQPTSQSMEEVNPVQHTWNHTVKSWNTTSDLQYVMFSDYFVLMFYLFIILGYVPLTCQDYFRTASVIDFFLFLSQKDSQNLATSSWALQYMISVMEKGWEREVKKGVVPLWVLWFMKAPAHILYWPISEFHYDSPNMMNVLGKTWWI